MKLMRQLAGLAGHFQDEWAGSGLGGERRKATDDGLLLDLAWPVQDIADDDRGLGPGPVHGCPRCLRRGCVPERCAVSASASACAWASSMSARLRRRRSGCFRWSLVRRGRRSLGLLMVQPPFVVMRIRIVLLAIIYACAHSSRANAHFTTPTGTRLTRVVFRRMSGPLALPVARPGKEMADDRGAHEQPAGNDGDDGEHPPDGHEQVGGDGQRKRCQ